MFQFPTKSAQSAPDQFEKPTIKLNDLFFALLMFDFCWCVVMIPVLWMMMEHCPSCFTSAPTYYAHLCLSSSMGLQKASIGQIS